MHDRSALGPADVSDTTLAAMLATLYDAGDAAVTVVSSHAEPVDYELPAITTGGRWWVRGVAAVDGHERDLWILGRRVA